MAVFTDVTLTGFDDLDCFIGIMNSAGSKSWDKDETLILLVSRPIFKVVRDMLTLQDSLKSFGAIRQET